MAGQIVVECQFDWPRHDLLHVYKQSGLLNPHAHHDSTTGCVCMYVYPVTVRVGPLRGPRWLASGHRTLYQCTGGDVLTYKCAVGVSQRPCLQAWQPFTYIYTYRYVSGYV